jgi:hypothetical protein
MQLSPAEILADYMRRTSELALLRTVIPAQISIRCVCVRVCVCVCV